MALKTSLIWLRRWTVPVSVTINYQPLSPATSNNSLTNLLIPDSASDSSLSLPASPFQFGPLPPSPKPSPPFPALDCITEVTESAVTSSAGNSQDGAGPQKTNKGKLHF